MDFVGISETKKGDYPTSTLRALFGNVRFDWCSLRARGSAGGILVGANANLFTLTSGDILDYIVSVMLTNKVTGFAFKLITVYDTHEDDKQAFLDELHQVMASWQGPTIIGGDFNLVRCMADKSNGLVNYRWVDLFND